MIDTKYNGVLWLARNLFISKQFLGNGKTEKEAIKNMNETIKRHNLKDNTYLVNKYGQD